MIGTNAARSPLGIFGARPMLPPGDFAPVALPGIVPPAINERPAWAGGEGLYKAGLGGVLQRAGDQLQAPGVGAALFRSGAATLNGGLGEGLATAAGYMDQRRAGEAREAQQAIENDATTRGLDLRELGQKQTNDIQLMGVGLDGQRLDETRRSNRAREGLDANGQRIQLYGTDTSAATQRRGQDIDVLTTRERLAQDDANNRRSTGASIYGTNVGYASDQVHAAGIGSKGDAGYTETKTKIPGANPWFGASTPASEVVTRTPSPIAVASPTSPPPAGAIAALRANPGLRGQFEAKYGGGSAAAYLGGR